MLGFLVALLSGCVTVQGYQEQLSKSHFGEKYMCYAVYAPTMFPSYFFVADEISTFDATHARECFAKLPKDWSSAPTIPSYAIINENLFAVDSLVCGAVIYKHVPLTLFFSTFRPEELTDERAGRCQEGLKDQALKSYQTKDEKGKRLDS